MKKVRKANENSVHSAIANTSHSGPARVAAETVNKIIEKLVADGYPRLSISAVVHHAIKRYAESLGIEPEKPKELP